MSFIFLKLTGRVLDEICKGIKSTIEVNLIFTISSKQVSITYRYVYGYDQN